MAHCWETRGCDQEMQSRCPHNLPHSPCPADCHYAICMRPTRKVVDALDALMNPDVDRSAPIKETCLLCEFFLTNGPKIPEDPSARRKPLMANRRTSFDD